MFRARRVSRYVLAELFTPTLLGLSLYTFVLLMNHFFVVAEKALAKNLGWDLTLRLFVTGIPNLLVLSIPMSVLLGSLIAVGRLSGDQEWTALQAAGAGPMRLLRPVALHGLGWALVCFLIYGYVVPRSNYELRNLRAELIFASNLAADLKPRVFYTGLPDTVLFVDEIRAGSKGRLEGVLVIRTDPRDRSTELILADAGDLYPAPDRSGALVLDLYGGVAHKYREESPDDVYHFAPRFKEARERFDPKDYMVGLLASPPDKVVQDFTPPELWDELREARTARLELEARSRADPGGLSRGDRFLVDSRFRRVTIELHQRLALPLASFFFAVLSLPLGIARVRSGKGAGFALSLLVILVYWATFTFSRDQALLGRIPPILGTWSGNLVVLPWALHGLWRMRRPPSDSEAWVPRLFRLFGRALRALRRGMTWRRRRPVAADRALDTEAGELHLADLGGTSARFVGRLDQYIAAYYLRILVFTVVSCYLIYGLIESKGLMDGLLRTREPFSLFLSYFPYFVPGVMHIVLPVSCLIGAIVTFTLLTRSGELTAIKASGISVRRATVATVMLTAMVCGLLFLVQDRIAPGTNQKAQAIKDRIMGNAPRTYGVPTMGRWGFGPQARRLYHYRLYDADRREFQGLSVFELDRDKPRILSHRFAEKAIWLGDRWELRGGWYRSFPADGSIGGVTFERYDEPIFLELAPPSDFAGQERTLRYGSNLSEQMGTRELREQIESLEESGYDATRLKVALHAKFSQSLTPLVMVLLGLPFAFVVGRRGSLYGVGVAFLLVLVYWAVLAIFNALGLETLLEPWMAAWAPNVLFGLLGSYLMLFVRT